MHRSEGGIQLTILEAAYEVLRWAGQPLDYHDIANMMLKNNIWETDCKNPAKSVYSVLSKDINKKGDNSRFCHIDDINSEYYLCFSLKENRVDVTSPLTLVDAAECVLEHYAKNEPMHYAEIAQKARELNLIQSEALDLKRAMYSSIHQEIQRKTAQGLVARFEKYDDGMIGLQRWHIVAVTNTIEDHNQEVKKKLKTRINKSSSTDFEKLIGYDLLPALGFEDVVVTPPSHDGGIDIRGTLVVGDVVRIQIAVQVKNWTKNNVTRPDIQKLRGSLGKNELGLFITSSDFSDGARKEAEKDGEIPISLMNGEQLITLLIEHGILSKRISRTIIDLA